MNSNDLPLCRTSERVMTRPGTQSALAAATARALLQSGSFVAFAAKRNVLGQKRAKMRIATLRMLFSGLHGALSAAWHVVRYGALRWFCLHFLTPSSFFPKRARLISQLIPVASSAYTAAITYAINELKIMPHTMTSNPMQITVVTLILFMLCGKPSKILRNNSKLPPS